MYDVIADDAEEQVNAKSFIRKKVGAGAHHMKEQKVVDEIKPTAPSTMRENRKTIMNTIFKNMAALCSAYRVDLRHLAEEHDLGVTEDHIRKVDFILAYRLCNVQINRDDDHGKYVCVVQTRWRT